MVTSTTSLDARAARNLAPHGSDCAPFQVVDLTDLASAVYSPDYVVQSLVPRGHVTLLAGHGGLGKSILALTLAAHVVSAREWMGLYTAKLRTVFVSMEDTGDLIRMRLRNVCNAYGLAHGDVEGGLTVLDGTLSAVSLFTEYGYDAGYGPTAAWEELREQVKGAGFVIIDNATEAFDGLENDRRQVRGFMRELATLARQENAGVMLLTHIDKHAARYGGSGNSYSGSTAWHNSARSRLALIEEGGEPLLRQEKLNLGRLHAPIPLMFNDRGVLLPVSSTARTLADGADADMVLTALQQVLAGGGFVPTATAGPSQAIHALEAALPSEFATRDGHRRVKAALLRLQQAGRIVRRAYRNERRHTSERWELAQLGGES